MRFRLHPAGHLSLELEVQDLARDGQSGSLWEGLAKVFSAVAWFKVSHRGK